MPDWTSCMGSVEERSNRQKSVYPFRHMGLHVASLGFGAALLASPMGASALDMTCIHSELPNHSYTIQAGEGVYTWDDHHIERSWSLVCSEEPDRLGTCHRSERYGDRGGAVTIFQMMSDGTLIESGFWSLLDTSRVTLTRGYRCDVTDK